MKITAKEMDIIMSALLYAAEQVHSSDISVFETYEDRDCIAGKVSFSEERYAINEAKATLAEELYMRLDANSATSHDWDCTITNENNYTWPKYDIYPCDLDCYGECPKAVQDCTACRGWTNAQADAQIVREERKEQEYFALEGISE